MIYVTDYLSLCLTRSLLKRLSRVDLWEHIFRTSKSTEQSNWYFVTCCREVHWGLCDLAGEMRTKDDVLRIKARSDICAVIQKSVLLQKSGKNNYKGLCPFHQETAPSFAVNPERNTFHCYGCNEGGDVISFVRKIHNLSFVEALDYLENFNHSQAEQKVKQ